MNSNIYTKWVLFGGAGGAGFGFVITPLIYILVMLFFYDGVGLSDTVLFSIANGFTWGILGLIAGAFFGVFNPYGEVLEKD